jgi:hypothetical protein
VVVERCNLLHDLGRDEEASALRSALPDDSPAAQSTREHLRGCQLFAEAWSAYERGESGEPMRSEAEATLKAALEGAKPDRASAIKLDLITLSFIRDGDHHKALDAVIKLLGSETKWAAGLHKAWYHAKAAGMQSVARHYLECANVLEPTHRACARVLATDLLADAPPDPARALQVLAAAHRTRADWAEKLELAQRAIKGCLDAGVLTSALPALANGPRPACSTTRDPPSVSSRPRARFRNSIAPTILAALLSR